MQLHIILKKLTDQVNLQISLKNRLLIYFMLIAFIPAGIISIFYHVNLQQTLEKSIGESGYKIGSNIFDNIENRMQQAIQLTDWVYLDPDIIGLLQRKPSAVIGYDQFKVRAIKSIDRFFQLLPITSHAQAFILAGENQSDLRNGHEGYLINILSLTPTEWYRRGQKVGGKVVWGRITPNYTRVSSNGYVIPLIRIINDIETGQKLGTVIVLFNPSIFSDCYKGINLDKGEEIYLLDENGQMIYSSLTMSEKTLLQKEEFLFKLIRENTKNFFEMKIGSRKKLVIQKKSADTGWRLIQVKSIEEIKKQRTVITNTTLLLLGSTIFLCLWFSLFLSENFTRPIKVLVCNVKEIAKGNFVQPYQLKNKDEINELGKNIEKMARDIQRLLEESLDKEKQKREVEIRMLQSQINPHFLYNTLNSIKWMATMQGSEGIREMVSCLGRLLQEVTEGVNEKTTIAEELRILEDYVYIQRIRYKGKVDFKTVIPNEQILGYSIIKFILQPLVENAIFHGIEPKDGTGEIILSFIEEGPQIKIEVWDNGVGMTDEQIRKMTESGAPQNIRGFYRIGIRNVIQRVKLIYGEEYGLSFESKLGEFTRVTLIFPKERSGNLNKEGDNDEGLNC